jgi:glycosyltransferase involved in cell wall biosynthesis
MNFEAPSIATVVVLFGEQPKDRGQSLRELPGTSLILIANGDAACEWVSGSLQPIVDRDSLGWQILLQPDNPGLAHSYNAALQMAEAHWLLLLDQDSVFAANGFELLVELAGSAHPKVGIITGVVIDSELNSTTTREIELFDGATRTLEPPLFQNSGTLFRVDACRSVGGWWDRLKIDLVDMELGIRLSAGGWMQLHVSSPTIRHRLGKTTSHSIRGFTFHATHHSVDRRRGMGIALGLIIRKHGLRAPGARQAIRFMAGNNLGVIISESQKLRKLSAFFTGAIVGLTIKK